MPELRKITPQELATILADHKKWLESCKTIGRCADLTEADLRKAEMEGADLREAKLSWADLREANLKKAHLQGANLFEAKLQMARLYDAKLQGADLEGAHLDEAKLVGAQMQGAVLQETIMTGANLIGASLKGSYIKADLRSAKLENTNLHGAIVNNTDLRGAVLIRANFEGADVTGVKYDREGQYQGIRVATCYGSPMFKRHAQDQDWLEEYLATRDTWFQKVIARLWRLTSDYGRSLFRWALSSLLLAVLFGGVFWALGPASFVVPHLPQTPWYKGLMTMTYYSVVTFTTLGFGDVVPRDLSAAVLVMIEVIVGYVMLGGLISIFANKLARRS